MACVLIILLIVFQNGVVSGLGILEYPGMWHQIHIIAPADCIQGQQPQISLHPNLHVGGDSTEEDVVRSAFINQEQLDLDVILASLHILLFVLGPNMSDKAQGRMVVEFLMYPAGQHIQRPKRIQNNTIIPHDYTSVVLS